MTRYVQYNAILLCTGDISSRIPCAALLFDEKNSFKLGLMWKRATRISRKIESTFSKRKLKRLEIFSFVVKELKGNMTTPSQFIRRG